jgi:hypothetical protein
MEERATKSWLIWPVIDKGRILAKLWGLRVGEFWGNADVGEGTMLEGDQRKCFIM